MGDRYFNQDTFEFLTNLAQNNTRDWFEIHKSEYEAAVRSPSLNLIEDIRGELNYISPHFLAIPKKVGGSLMRIHRDIRFGKDKRPYKTNIGIQFRHTRGKDVHAPGFYIHIEPNECFLGVGIWRPDAITLAKIRDAIIAKPEQWKTTKQDKKFNRYFTLSGESLKNPPRGYDKEHPFVEDLKRKDFIAMAPLTQDQITTSGFRKNIVTHFSEAAPFMAYLCRALELNF